MLRLNGLTFAHPSVDSTRRAELSVPPGGVAAARRRLRAAGLEAFFLATCLRVEVAWLGEPESAAEVFEFLHGSTEPIGEGVMRQDEAAFEHLCRVAAGLDSPLVGEPEVLGQFRRAVATLQDAGQPAGSLGRVLEAAVGTARSARRLLAETPRGSLASLAATRAAPRGRVAVLGAGAMARAAIENLGDADVTVFARRPEPVAGHKPRSWTDFPEALADFPAVISAVPGKALLFDPDRVAEAIGRRRQPLLLVDLGMPPGFSRPDDDGLVTYLDVDDIASSVASPSVSLADDKIAEEATTNWRRLAAADRVGAVIAAVMGQAEKAVAEEVRRFAPRLATVDDPEQVLRQVARTVARRVLHPAISFLGKTDDDAVEVVAEAFGVER
jgi:glutamyl-tRNA reductase